MTQFSNPLERVFHLSRYGTNVRREVLAGLTTFMSMAYIFAVNPAMLAQTGMPYGAAFAATIWASVIPTLVMAFGANLPVVLAPGMGVNAFFTYTLVFELGLSWQSALGAVFLSGLLFLLCALTPIMRQVMRSVPAELKFAIGAGIGLFIAMVGFQNGGVIVSDPDTLLAMGEIKSLPVLLCLGGLLLSVFLMLKGVNGAILIGILLTTLAAMLFGQVAWPSSASDLFSLDVPGISETFLKMELGPVLKVSFISVLFTMTMVDMFNCMGTIIGISGKAQLAIPDEGGPNNSGKGEIRGLKGALIADSTGTMLGGLLGTSPVTSYLESVTGIAEGGRTGLTAVVAAILFTLCLFFAPLINLIPTFATAPALILVGALMLGEVSKIDFNNLETGLPAFLIVVSMPLTYSIVNGFGLGFISYTLIQILMGKAKGLHPVLILVSLLFILHFALA